MPTALAFNPDQPRDEHGRWEGDGSAPATDVQEWRGSLTGEQQAVVSKWEGDSRYCRDIRANPKSEPAQIFCSALETAPRTTDTTYRGFEESKGGYILSQEQSAQAWESRIGDTVKMNAPVSTSTDPAIAASFGHTVFAMDGGDSRVIGNSFSEAVQMPASYTVTGVDRASDNPVNNPQYGGSKFVANDVVVHLSQSGDLPWRGTTKGFS